MADHACPLKSEYCTDNQKSVCEYVNEDKYKSETDCSDAGGDLSPPNLCVWNTSKKTCEAKCKSSQCNADSVCLPVLK